MAFGAFDQHRQQGAMADINVTPMVDVMLVLLVIFIITAPMLTSAVQLELPRAPAARAPAPPEAGLVTIAIDGHGQLYWNDAAIDAAALAGRLAEAARRAPQPELRLRADKDTRYETVAQVMAAAQSSGLSKLGFVTDPGQPPNQKRK